MSLSTAILALFPVFLIPAIFLPSNRMKVFFIASLSSAVPVAVFILLCLFLPDKQLLLSFGNVFFSFYGAFYIEGMTFAEKSQVCLLLFCLLLYFVIYIVSYVLQKAFVLGSNVTIRIGPNPIGHFLYSFFFVLFTYAFLAVFLIGIRQILPLRDGFLSSFFQWLFPLEA